MFCTDPVRNSLAKSEKNKLESALQDAQDALLRGTMDKGYREMSKPSEVATSDEKDTFSVDRGQALGDKRPGIQWSDGGLGAMGDVSTTTPSQDWLANFDWESTELGPRDGWDPQLTWICQLLMADPWPSALYWGKDKTMIYNEHYRWILGRKHPNAMGQPFKVVWAEVFPILQPIFEDAATKRKAATSDDTEFYIERNGYIEQTFFSWSMMPIFGKDDAVVCYYNPTRETTVQKTLYRRTSLLFGLSQSLGTTNIGEFWPQLIDALDSGTHDVPFLLLYAAEGIEENDGALLVGNSGQITDWQLKGTIGYPTKLDALPKHIDFANADDDIKPFVERVQDAQEPILLSTTDGSFPARMLTTVHTRSYGQICTEAIFFPIRPFMTTTASSAGFIVIGVSPRRHYDDDYKLFIQLLMRQVQSSMASVLLFADVVSRGEKKATVLSQQLATQIRIAAANEARFQRMADYAPVAMFKIDAQGAMEYGNDDYFHLTMMDRSDKSLLAYRRAVHEDDFALAVDQWDRLTNKLIPVNDEMRLKKGWTSPDGTACPTWVVAAAYPELDLDGNLIGVLGCLTDISRQKWAEEVQSRRTEEAMELKRQQEMFIDMTSHELRNPLSAIIQCADGIMSSFHKPDSMQEENVEPSTMQDIDVEGVLDAAQTIVFCAQHQKRISDDVLILSKLNSDLVIITPVDVQPAEVIHSGLRVFDRELKKSGIQLSMNAEPSYHNLKVDSLRLDPSRMLQVLINLVSNAIKFTEPQRRRQIDVRFGASLTGKFPELDHLRFWEEDKKSSGPDHFASQDWGDGEVVYLSMSVQDTGRGLRAEEMDYLFQRFSQASPRTHIQYGGSGLGLFISKRLAEAQGGAIGVSSIPEQGSTFAFYIKTRRSPPSAVPLPVVPPVSDMIIIGENREVQVSIPIGGDVPGFSTRTTGPGSKATSPASSSFLSPVSGSGFPRFRDLPEKQVTKEHTETREESALLHVLIVEDNLVNQKVLAKQLEKAGYMVAIANHGVEALNHLKRTAFWEAGSGEPIEKPVRPGMPRRQSSRLSAESDHFGLGARNSISRASSTSSRAATAGSSISPASDPDIPLRLDIVLMDLEMPVMDGLTCVRRIRELQSEGKLNRVPVIAVTANARREQIDAAMEAGMDSVVCKPFRIPQLTKEIQTTLEKTRRGENGAEKTL